MAGLFAAMLGTKSDARQLEQLPGFLLNTESKTGISVTWSTALQVTAMLACARIVGEGIAQSRCRLMRPRKGRSGADVASDLRLHRLLFLSPETGMTAFGFWETIVFHVMFVGNAFIFINRVGGGEVHELLLLDPGRVRVIRMADRTLRYEVTGEDGRVQPVAADAMWHIRGPSWNGWMGLETVKVAREALGLSLALEASHAEMHKGGLKQSGTYSIEGELTVEQHAKMAQWLKRFATASTGEPLVLDRGAKWLTNQMTGVDSEHLATRRFMIEEVCRPVRVMPIMLGVAEKTATYASAEQMFNAHETHTLAPWAGRLEQSGEVSLLTEAEQAEGVQLKFNLSALRRGDYKGRQEGLQIQRRNGVISANEWRDLEDMNPREDAGGDQYVVEANMAIQDGRDLQPAKTSTKAD